MNKTQLKYLIHLVNEDFKTDFKPEIAAIPGRKFRFDYCDLNLKIAIEYEGIISEKSRLIVPGCILYSRLYILLR